MRLKTDYQADAIALLYRAAEAELKLLIREAVASGSLGELRYRRNRLVAVQAILRRLEGQALPEAHGLVHDSYETGMAIAGSVGDFGSGIHEEAIATLVDQIDNGLKDATVKVGRQVNDVFRREGLRQSALRLALGVARRTGSDAMAQALRDQGVKAFTDKLGRSWGLETYSRMVLRTTSREAVTTATRNRMVEQGEDLVAVSLSDKACPRCVEAYKGKTFSLTGATPGYPVLLTPPPLHPNDRCVMHASTSSLAALEARLGLAGAVG